VTLLLSTPCEHGETGPHGRFHEDGPFFCPGGSLTPLQPDYRAAAREIATDDGYDWDELTQATQDSLILRAGEHIAAALHLDQGET
jgi:hypothetical protein